MFKNHISLPILSDQHNYFTRNRENFIAIYRNFSLTENDFYYRATRSYNNLPENVKKFHNITSFKNRLKEYLYNSIVEANY